MKELSEDSKFQVSLKTLGGIVVLIVTLVGMFFTLQADINEAKLLPQMPISEKEFELKDKLIRASILTTQEDVKEIKEDMKYLRNKMDNVN